MHDAAARDAVDLIAVHEMERDLLLPGQRHDLIDRPAQRSLGQKHFRDRTARQRFAHRPATVDDVGFGSLRLLRLAFRRRVAEPARAASPPDVPGLLSMAWMMSMPLIVVALLAVSHEILLRRGPAAESSTTTPFAFN